MLNAYDQYPLLKSGFETMSGGPAGIAGKATGGVPLIKPKLIV